MPTGHTHGTLIAILIRRVTDADGRLQPNQLDTLYEPADRRLVQRPKPLPDVYRFRGVAFNQHHAVTNGSFALSVHVNEAGPFPRAHAFHAMMMAATSLTFRSCEFFDEILPRNQSRSLSTGLRGGRFSPEHKACQNSGRRSGRLLAMEMV